MQQLLFWLIVAVVAVGQLLLIASAWRLRREGIEAPPGVPRSNAHADLGWTVAAAALTGLLLAFAFQALP